MFHISVIPIAPPAMPDDIGENGQNGLSQELTGTRCWSFRVRVKSLLERPRGDRHPFHRSPITGSRTNYWRLLSQLGVGAKRESSRRVSTSDHSQLVSRCSSK